MKHIENKEGFGKRVIPADKPVVDQILDIAGHYNSIYPIPFPVAPDSFRGRVERARKILKKATSRIAPKDAIMVSLIAIALLKANQGQKR